MPYAWVLAPPELRLTESQPETLDRQLTVGGRVDVDFAFVVFRFGRDAMRLLDERTAAELAAVAGLTSVGPDRKAFAEPTKVGAEDGNFTGALGAVLAIAIGIEIPLRINDAITASVAKETFENFIFSEPNLGSRLFK